MVSNQFTLGGLRFDGVEIQKSQVKNQDGKNLYCVWTDAGYIEYAEQKKDAEGESSATIRSITDVDFRDRSEYQQMYKLNGKYKQLYLHDVTNATFKYDSDNYISVGVGGDDEGFTLDTRNGRADKLISVFNNAKVITDDNDYVRKKILPKF